MTEFEIEMRKNLQCGLIYEIAFHHSLLHLHYEGYIEREILAASQSSSWKIESTDICLTRFMMQMKRRFSGVLLPKRNPCKQAFWWPKHEELNLFHLVGQTPLGLNQKCELLFQIHEEYRGFHPSMNVNNNHSTSRNQGRKLDNICLRSQSEKHKHGTQSYLATSSLTHKNDRNLTGILQEEEIVRSNTNHCVIEEDSLYSPSRSRKDSYSNPRLTKWDCWVCCHRRLRMSMGESPMQLILWRVWKRSKPSNMPATDDDDHYQLSRKEKSEK